MTPFESTKTQVEPVRMWANGPLRLVSDAKEYSSWLRLADGRYAGQYVCDTCLNPVMGVYQASGGVWLCSDCRRKAKTPSPSGKNRGRRTKVSA